MSDALLRIASSMILLTKRTIGASSTSSRDASGSIESSACETSRFSRAKSPAPVHDRRVPDGDVQALAALDERQDAVLGEQLVADELDDVHVDRHRVEIEQ